MRKRITRTIATFVTALAMMMWTNIPAQAEYGGRLQRGQDWALVIDNTSGFDIVVTVFYLTRRVEVIRILTVPGGTRATYPFSKPGTGVRRLIVEVDPTRGGNPIVEVTQGNFSHGLTVLGQHDSLVFDIAAPRWTPTTAP